LVRGKWSPCGQTPDGRLQYSIAAPHASEAGNAREDVAIEFEVLRQVLRLGIYSGWVDVIDGMPEGLPAEAVTVHKGPYGVPFIYLAWEKLEPLLKGGLSDAETLIEQFNVAVSIVHETAVSEFVLVGSESRYA
jgi:hypothetical protein